MVSPGTSKTIGGYTFTNWGSHSNDYPHPYLTAAAAIGMNRQEIDTFCKRLDKTLTKFKKKHVVSDQELKCKNISNLVCTQ